MSTWETHEGVTCVECPKCAFTFDADHTDHGTSDYSCPLCAEVRLREAGRHALAMIVAAHPDEKADVAREQLRSWAALGNS